MYKKCETKFQVFLEIIQNFGYAKNIICQGLLYGIKMKFLPYLRIKPREQERKK
jgi:hypothetical protein